MLLNRNYYLNKLKGCWVGKNIGGTIGGPYESSRTMLDVKGFSTPKGEPLPNDDLDLQLVWLLAVEHRGIKAITPQVLAEYWLDFIPAVWNEYEIGKANLRLGLLPPYSGEYNNEKWKNSNGAWIRTEIWACLFPGKPDLAVRYAYYDACVDHGMGEGTFAAMFIAALESAAFFESDIRKLIEKGLSYIPENCRVAQCVRLAIKLYDEKKDIVTARNTIVESVSDMGWFQAPGNIGFVILGLLYGEKDYKKSILTAVNCGDDTDCTAATVGSILGIIYGFNGIPQDWSEYVGDKIVSISINLSFYYAKSCSELSKRVYELVPSCFMAYGIYMEYTDGENDLTENARWILPDISLPKTGLSFDFPDLIYAKGRVELSACEIAPDETIELTFTFKDTSRYPRQIEVELSLPESWTADKKYARLYTKAISDKEESVVTVKVTAGECVNLKNVINARIGCVDRPAKCSSEIIIWGKN